MLANETLQHGLIIGVRRAVREACQTTTLSCVCQVLQKLGSPRPRTRAMSSRRSRPSSPDVTPDRSAARKGALDLRGLRTLAREHRSGIFGATTGGLAGSHLIPLVGRAMVLAFSCRLPHQLLFVLFQVLHMQISRGLNPVLVHLDG